MIISNQVIDLAGIGRESVKSGVGTCHIKRATKGAKRPTGPVICKIDHKHNPK